MQNKKTKIFKALLLGIIVLEIFTVPMFAVHAEDTPQYKEKYTGVEDSIKQYLCTPGNETFFQCVNKMYRVAIAFGSVIAVFFIVIAGYVYMSDEGGGEGKKKGKDILVSSITGLVLLYVGYVLLRYLNPDIVTFQPIQPPDIKQAVDNISNVKNNCTNCQDYTKSGLGGNSSQKPGVNTYLNQDLIAKLLKAKNIYGEWVISEAYPPTVKHDDPCHNNGTCADINVINKNPQSVNSLCRALRAAGLQNTNEYYSFTQAQTPDCPEAKKYDTTTGENMHVK